MPVADEVWSAFSTAGFTCWTAEGAPIVVRPAPPGTRAGPFPFAGPVAFLTTDNPHGRVVPDAENARRRAGLGPALDGLGLRWLPAVGGDPAGEHREPGAIVLGLDLAAAAGLGARFDQAAVYVWEPEALHLVACAEDRHDVLGYVAEPGAP